MNEIDYIRIMLNLADQVKMLRYTDGKHRGDSEITLTLWDVEQYIDAERQFFESPYIYKIPRESKRLYIEKHGVKVYLQRGERYVPFTMKPSRRGNLY